MIFWYLDFAFNMRKFFLLFLFCYIFLPDMGCFAQLSSFGKNQNIDSLNILLQKDAEDTNMVIHLCAMAREISRQNIDSAEYLSKKAMLISNQLNYTGGLALANIHWGWCDIVKGNYIEALKKLSTAHSLASKINNQKLVSIALTNMGTIYHNESEYDKALQYFFQSLTIDKKINNDWGIARNWGVIGLSYFKLNNDSNALEYYRMALQLTSKLGNSNGSAVWMGNIGDIYFRQKNYPQALNYFQKALAIFTELKNAWVMAEMKIKIAKIYEQEKNYPEANQLLTEALVLSKSIGALDRQKEVYLALSDLYASSTVLLKDKSGNPMANFEQQKLNALDHFKNAKQIQDSLFSREKQKDLAKFEQAKIDAIKEAELNNEKKMSFYYILSSITFFIGLMIAIGLTIFARKKLKENKKISRELALKNLIIENKQKEITDSIEYAQRIQFAILPSLENIQHYFPKSFVLFMPKDIVSGDFFWFNHNQGKPCIAACDCTGHGVPGALMSMVAADQLNDAFKSASDPAEILKTTNKNLKTALNQRKDENSTRDGMDIALISFNSDLSSFTFCGANRPLWIFPKATKEIIEIKGTKAAIGGLTPDNQTFESHTLRLKEGDTLYFFTDGYADQFNPADKKLMTKRFKELLLTIQELSMQQQEKHLKDFILDWKKDTEQTDDILVMGISI